jgi:hypothetical protein
MLFSILPLFVAFAKSTEKNGKFNEENQKEKRVPAELAIANCQLTISSVDGGCRIGRCCVESEVGNVPENTVIECVAKELGEALDVLIAHIIRK